jgi:hypothetical protein
VKRNYVSAVGRNCWTENKTDVDTVNTVNVTFHAGFGEGLLLYPGMDRTLA